MQESSNESMFVPKYADRPPCESCHKLWPVPRRVAYKLIPHVPSHISPTTTETVVAFQTVDRYSQPHFPERVFEEVQYTASSLLQHRLVSNFRYNHQSGKVRFSDDGDDESHERYAQLVTLNSWYRSLLDALMYVSFSVIDVQTNLLMVVRVLYDADLVAHEDSQAARHAFVASWIGLMVLSVFLAIREALWEWDIKSSPKQGDLIPGSNWIDRWVSFLALVLFALFSVENMVKDIVTVLHPWKSVQPYAAMKFENTRSYVVGWKTESMFRVENRPGAQLTLPVQLATRTLAFAFKLYLCFLFLRIDLLAATASSVPSIVWGWYRFITLSRSRRSFHKYLISRLKSGTIEDGERRAMEKMLARHFKQRMNKYYRAKSSVLRVSRNEFKEDSLKQKELCDSCGRPKGDVVTATPRRRRSHRIDASSWDIHGRSKTPREARLMLQGMSFSDRGVGLASGDPGKFWQTKSVISESEASPGSDSTIANLQPDTSDPERGRLMCTVPAHLWQMVDQAREEGRGLLLLLDGEPTDGDLLGRERAETCQPSAPSQASSDFCKHMTAKSSIESSSVCEVSTTEHAVHHLVSASRSIRSIDSIDDERQKTVSSPLASDHYPLFGCHPVLPGASPAIESEEV